MKKTLLSLMMMVIAVTATAQTIGEAFYIYRNDGGFNAFFREEVDSIVYSNYDTDSIYYDDVVTQVVYTPDSIYRIPLAVIDSVGFVQPETIYEEGVKVLDGELFDYVIAVDGMNITMAANTPEWIKPKQDEIVATVELTDKFPCGFFGKVSSITSTDDGITLYCDSIPLEDALIKFYGMVEMGSEENQAASMRKAPGGAKYFVFDLPEINIPVDLSGFIRKKKIFNIEGKASFNFKVQPDIRGKVAYVIDKNILLSYVNVHTANTLYFDTDFEIAGVATKEFKKNLLPPNLSDPPMPYGIPLHIEIGPKLEINGEIGAGFNASTSITCVQDITYRPLLSFNPVTAVIANRITMSAQRGPFNIDWKYVAGRATFKGGLFLRIGLRLGKSSSGFIGGEVDGPLKGNFEIYFDIDRLQQADKSTALYDEIKDLLKLDINTYVGAKFIASFLDDKYRFEIPKDFEIPGLVFSGRLLPEFSDITSQRLKGQHGNAEVFANISKACPIPFTIGYTLIDSEGNKTDTCYNQKYSLFNNFPSYTMNIKNLYGGKKYKCYPMIKLFGHNVLASPVCNLPASLQTSTLGANYITRESAQLIGQIEDYNPNLDNGECGFFYNSSGNPSANNGKQVYVGQLPYFPNGEFLTELEELESNTTYYYRAYYYADGNYFYGNVSSIKTENDPIITCPDENHPHWIDLGLPSGTKWRCCNEGAYAPEEIGGHYRFDVVSTAPSLTQINELVGHCSYCWMNHNGVEGGCFTGSNGWSIFLPAAGEFWNPESEDYMTSGVYWSSTPLEEFFAGILYFGPSGAYWEGDWRFNRMYENTVRPVSK